MFTFYTVHRVRSDAWAVIETRSSTATGRIHGTRTVAWHDTCTDALTDAGQRNAA